MFPRAPRPPTWTLRRRLLVGVLLVSALVSAVLAAVSIVTLDGALTERVDAQLVSAANRSEGAAGRPGPGRGPGREDAIDDGPGPGFLLAPGQAEGTLGALVEDGVVQRAAVLNQRGEPVEVDPGRWSALGEVPADGEPHTLDLGNDLGSYRLLATEVGDDVLVTGLSLRDARDTVTDLAAVLGVVALLGLVGAALAGALVVRTALRPLQRITSTASRVAELPLDRGEVALAERVPAAQADPATEVGQVGAALNRLLGHVAAALTARQASEARVRRFVADASHELRTPLAAIRGYAELPRRSGADLPADVVHALGRVESEADRMGVLVEDLLLLARLDEGRPLASAPVDLTRLVIDVVGDAHAAAPDHRFELVLPDEPVEATGDEGRLHQVLANLLANTRVHTPAGTTVTVELEPLPQNHAVAMSVTDDGPGIDSSVLPTVFERFVRADDSRRRAAGPAGGSTGLGLAIVAAVVEAHGGAVTVASRPGHTRFVVTLPVSGPTSRSAGSP